MNRTGLFVALGVGLVTGLLFAVFPQLDVALAHLFYDSGSRQFTFNPFGKAEYIRRAAMWIAWGFAAPAIVALAIKVIHPHKPLLISGRAVIFLLSTIFITAIVLPDIVVKHHWGRPRPIATTEFNGSQEFKPWWKARNGDWHNTSFFSGEAATAFWTYAPAALAPPTIRPFAFLAATLFGLTTGLLRMAFGAHYASDIIAAGMSAFLVVWFGYALIYRWNIWRTTDVEIDRWLTDKIGKVRAAKTFWRLAAIVGALTIARLIALKFSVVDLFPDEARYWSWAQTPEFGYSSKPPLIGWIINGAIRLCGNSEACLRTPASLFYAGSSLIAFFIGRQLYGERIAFWSGLSAALVTGVVYSTRIISTDVPLIFFWTVALLAYVKILKRPTATRFVALGLAIGLGLLSKYAMAYFLAGMIVASFMDPAACALWSDRRSWFAFATALVVVAPNLIWNATHNFVTFHRTWGNVVGPGLHPNLLGALDFLGAQFGVYGPITFSAFLFTLVRPKRFPLETADRILLAFALPPLVVVTVAALLTSAQANWAAPAGIPIIIFAVAILIRQRQRLLLYASLAIGIGLQLALWFGDAFADRVSVSFLSKPDVYHRTMGWKTLATLVRQNSLKTGARSIAAEQRDVDAELHYYLRGDGWPIFAEQSMIGDVAEPVLFVSQMCDLGKFSRSYSTIEKLEPIDVPTGTHSSRHYCLFKLSGARADTAGSTSLPH